MKAFVKTVEWLHGENRHVVHLVWEGGETSKVYDHDENSIWFRYRDAN